MKALLAALMMLPAVALADSASSVGISTGTADYLCTEYSAESCHNEVVVIAPSKATTKSNAQKTLSSTNVATVIFGSSTPCNGLTVKALGANAAGGTIYVGYTSGVTTSNGFPLAPRDSVYFAAPNDGDCAGVYIIGTSGDGVAVVTQ